MRVSQTTFIASALDPQAATPNGLQNPDATSVSKRFDVYRNNIAVSLSDALVSAFPIVRALVGEAFFRAMAGVYLRQHPPRSPRMMFYGAQMPDFLQGFAPAQSVPYLPDVARLELALRNAYHAADIMPIADDALGALSVDVLMNKRMRLAPATQVIVSAYPIHAIHRAHTVDSAAHPVMQPETVLITRSVFDPCIHLMEPASANFIISLQGGATLDQAMTAAGDTCDLGTTLGILLAQRAVTEIY